MTVKFFKFGGINVWACFFFFVGLPFPKFSKIIACYFYNQKFRESEKNNNSNLFCLSVLICVSEQIM